MGTFTNSRSLPALRGKTWRNGSVFSGTDPGCPPGYLEASYPSGGSVQTTTSYRSGKKWDALPTDLETGNPSHTWAGATHDIAKQAQDERPWDRPYDTGHTFSTSLKQMESTKCTGQEGTYGGFQYKYSGNIVVVPTAGYPGWGTIPGFSSTFYGTDAISKSRPLNPVVGLASLLAELKREGFPKPTSRLRSYLSRGDTGLSDGMNTVADEYLAGEFGLKPVLSELQNLANVTKSYRERLEQLQRDSGRVIRRRYTYPVETSVQDLSSVYGNAKVGTVSNTTGVRDAIFPAGTQLHSIRCVRETTRRIWFSGAYTYLLPGTQAVDTNGRENGDGGLYSQLLNLESRVNALLGTRVGADVAWNLMPWSWLADWNANIGTNISNAEALRSDGLVLRYGYLMCRTDIRTSITGYGPRLPNGYTGPYTQTWIHTKKDRYRASPYGFALNPNAYSARQWAILASLGITKAPGVLW